MSDAVTNTVGIPLERENYFDPPGVLGRWRAQAPIRRIPFADGHLGWLVTSYSGVRAILADGRFSTRMDLHHPPTPELALQYALSPPAAFFPRMDPPEHTRYRRLLNGQFTGRRMKRLEPRIQQITTDLLDEMELEGPPTDLVQSFALPLPSLVICELLGVPHADRDRFQRSGATLLGRTESVDRLKAAKADLNEYVGALVARNRVEPADDLLGDLVAGGELSDTELAGIAQLLLIGGHETTMNMISLGTFTLLRNPAELAALRDDPALVVGAVEELLRYLSIADFVVRTALEDVEIDGHTIEKGDSVVVSLPAANRDPQRFETPDTLDLAHRASGHVAFGHGIHQCIGAQLARIEMRIAFPALLTRFRDLRLDVPPDEIPLRSHMSFYGVHRLPVTWGQ